jgi:hypothetical protein
LCSGNPRIEPAQFTEEDVIARLHSEYMFLGCIQFILDMKTGPFFEHSNQLWNISGTNGWTKVNQGLIKMYKGEILAKHPVVQHILFGSMLSVKPFDKTKIVGPANKGRLSSGMGGARFGSHPPPGPPLFNANANAQLGGSTDGISGEK